MNEGEFRELVELGGELRRVEFKGPGVLGDKDKRLRAKVVRAMLSMANTRNGGTVVIGVDDIDGRPSLTGMTDEIARTWNHDRLADALRGFAEPSIQFRLSKFEIDEGHYVAIDVEEFAEVPIVCRGDYDNVLRRAAVYVRSINKPETSEVASFEAMRDLLELATEKGVRRLLQQINSIGVNVTELAKASGNEVDAIRSALATEPFAERVRQGAHADLVLLPMPALSRPSMSILEIAQQVRRWSIEAGGWRFPFAQANGEEKRYLDFVQESVDASHFRYYLVEIWRMYQDARFTHLTVIPTRFDDEWRRVGEIESAPLPKRIGVYRTLRYLTKVFEFAARVLRHFDELQAMTIDLAINGIAETELFIDNSRRARFNYQRLTHMPSFPLVATYTKADLIPDPRRQAAIVAREFYSRFGWDVDLDVIADMQREVMAH